MSTPADQLNSPDYKCKAYLEMMGDVRLVRTVMGGTKALRAARGEYLPQYQKEKPAEYESRLKRTFDFNATKKTHGGLLGMVYRENPKLKESVPDLIRQHWENIDLKGNHGDVFTKEVLSAALRDGHAFTFVDMAKPVPQAPGFSRADEIGRRPYWLMYTKDQACNWFSDYIKGEQVLTQITFKECAQERAGIYGEKEVTRYRRIYLPLLDDGKDETGTRAREPVYETMQWELYEETEGQPEGAKFRLVGSGSTGLPRIPLAVTYAKQTGFLESEPLLLDLAYLNIDWWQQNSDYRSQLHKLVPILTRIGLPDALRGNTDFDIGVGSLVDLPITSKDQHPPDLKYVSHDGVALGAARQALLDVKELMGIAGLSILTQRVDSNITLGEKKMDQQERTSELATAARSHRDAIEFCLGRHAQYLNLADQMGDGGAIELGVSEETLIADPQMMGVMNQMIDKGRFAVEELFAYMAGGMKAIDFEELLKKVKAFEAKPPAVSPPPAPENGAMNKEEMTEEMTEGGVQ